MPTNIAASRPLDESSPQLIIPKPLSIAQISTPSHFFHHRCIDRNHRCLILHIDEDFLYYDLSSSKSPFAVLISELQTHFPDYQYIDSDFIDKLVDQYLDSIRPAHKFRVLQTSPIIPFLKRDGIEISVDWQYQIDTQKGHHLSLCLFIPWGERLIRRIY